MGFPPRAFLKENLNKNQENQGKLPNTLKQLHFALHYAFFDFWPAESFSYDLNDVCYFLFGFCYFLFGFCYVLIGFYFFLFFLLFFCYVLLCVCYVFLLVFVCYFYIFAMFCYVFDSSPLSYVRLPAAAGGEHMTDFWPAESFFYSPLARYSKTL